MKTPYVLNCTWQNAEEINGQMEFKLQDEWTNRLKVLARVELPESLREMHSSFFLVGAHCMVSNLGNGTALMSFAPVTNIKNFSIHIPAIWTALIEGKRENLDIHTIMPDIQKYLDDKLFELPTDLKTYLDKHTDPSSWNHQELLKLYFGLKIRDGVAKYVPKMLDAKVLDVQFGFVKTKGAADILDPKGAFHSRAYSGIEENRTGWITNSLVKLFYAVDNGNEVQALLENHFNEDRRITLDILTRCRGDVEEARKMLDTGIRWWERQRDFEVNPDLSSDDAEEDEQSLKEASLIETASSISPKFFRSQLEPSVSSAPKPPKGNLLNSRGSSSDISYSESPPKNEEDTKRLVAANSIPPRSRSPSLFPTAGPPIQNPSSSTVVKISKN